MATSEAIGVLAQGKKKKTKQFIGQFAPGEGGYMSPQDYENWKKNIQNKDPSAELIDTLKRYNPPRGRLPQSTSSDLIGQFADLPTQYKPEEKGTLAYIKKYLSNPNKTYDESMLEMLNPEQYTKNMAYRRENQNYDNQENLKNVLGQSDSWGKNMIGSPSRPPLKSAGRSPQSYTDPDMQLTPEQKANQLNMPSKEEMDQQYIQHMKEQGATPEQIQQYLNQVKKTGRSPQGENMNGALSSGAMDPYQQYIQIMQAGGPKTPEEQAIVQQYGGATREGEMQGGRAPMPGLGGGNIREGERMMGGRSPQSQEATFTGSPAEMGLIQMDRPELGNRMGSRQQEDFLRNKYLYKPKEMTDEQRNDMLRKTSTWQPAEQEMPDYQAVAEGIKPKKKKSGALSNSAMSELMGLLRG